MVTSLLILAFILAMSLLLKDQIQIVLDFTGGICATLVLFFVATAEIIGSRKLLQRDSPTKKFPGIPKLFYIVGIVFLGFSIYGTF